MNYKIIQNEDPDIIANSFNMERREHLFWHCKLFSFEAPQIMNDNDPFEDVVLALFENNITDLGIIADKTCLDKEFIETVYARLVAKEYIDKSNNQVLVIKDKEESKYQTLYGLQDTVSKKVLPHFLRYEPSMFEGELYKHDRLSLYLGKKKELISGLIIEKKKCSKKDELDENLKSELTGEAVLDALKIKYSRDLKSSCLLMKNPNSMNSELVRIIDKTEDVYLYCSKFIQKGNLERLLISDGFNEDVSDLFIEEYLNGSTNIENNKNNKNSYSKYIETNSKVFNLGKIKQKIDKFEEYKNGIKDIDESKRYEDRYAKIINNLYRTLEFIMLNAYLKNPLIQNYSYFLPGKDNYKNSKFITDESINIGFNRCKIRFKSDGIKKIKPNCNEPEMEALLNLFILKGVEDNKNSLKAFAQYNPNFIEFLYEFKGMRDSATHTNTVDKKQDLNEVYLKVLEFNNFLLPVKQNDIEQQGKKHKSSKNLDNLVDESIETIVRRLGEIGYYKQNDYLRHKLLTLELDVRQSPPYTIITDLDIIFSHLYEQKIKKRQISDTEINNYSTKELYKRLKRNKFEMEYFELKSLKSVNPNYIRKTLEDKETYTLGSCYLAYLWLLNDRELVKEGSFKISSVLTTVLKHRGHGEKIGMIIDKTEVDELISSLYKHIINQL
jgi:hypothetical protein